MIPKPTFKPCVCCVIWQKPMAKRTIWAKKSYPQTENPHRMGLFLDNFWLTFWYFRLYNKTITRQQKEAQNGIRNIQNRHNRNSK